MVLATQDAVTPVGSPVAVPMPEAAMVVCVILANRVFIHSVGVLDATFTPLTVIVPLALALPQPVTGMV